MTTLALASLTRSTEPGALCSALPRRLAVGALLVLTACASAPRDARSPPRASVDAGPIDARTPSLPDSAHVARDAAPTGLCTSGPEEDLDSDGTTRSGGDCDDCNPLIGPEALDAPDNEVDEDCDGLVARSVEGCDGALALDSSDPDDAARALGLCRFVEEADGRWGVLSARWTTPDGRSAPVSHVMHGLPDAFGVERPRAGARMLALSTGAARAPGQPGYTPGCDELSAGPTGAPPDGLGPDTPACPGVRTGAVYDAIALEVRLRAPANARGLRFASSFYTYEYPDYICSPYNDFFTVIAEPRPLGSPDGNVVFDADGNRVSVNNSLLRACVAGRHGGRTFDCPLGVMSLTGTSYDTGADCSGLMDEDPDFAELRPGASTGWLTTEIPVSPRQVVVLRFAIWDSGDASLDSLVLLDAVEWLLEDPGEVHTDPVLF